MMPMTLAEATATLDKSPTALPQAIRLMRDFAAQLKADDAAPPTLDADIAATERAMSGQTWPAQLVLVTEAAEKLSGYLMQHEQEIAAAAQFVRQRDEMIRHTERARREREAYVSRHTRGTLSAIANLKMQLDRIASNLGSVTCPDDLAACAAQFDAAVAKTKAIITAEVAGAPQPVTH